MSKGKRPQVATRLSKEEYQKFVEAKAKMMTERGENMTNDEFLRELILDYWEREVQQKKLDAASKPVNPFKENKD